jgi:heme-degrading monooxygenase HmoA
MTLIDTEFDALVAGAAWFEPVLTPTPRQLSDRQLAERLTVIDRERRRIEAELVEVMAETDRRDAHRADGHRTVTTWSRAHTRWSNHEATARRRLARLCEAAPVVAESLATGVLGVAQAHELGRAFANPRCGHELPGVIAIMLVHAERLSYEDFCVVVRRWEALADADGSHRSHEQSHANRRARFHHDDTSVTLDAVGGTAQGAEMQAIFERYCDAEFRTDWDAAVAAHGDRAALCHLPRTARQRAFDALHRIFLDAAAAPPGSVPPEPVLDIVVDIATFERLLHLGDGQVRPHDDPRWWRRETSTGVPLPDDAVLRAALLGRVRRVVIDAAGIVVDVGRARRLFTGPSRRVVLALQGWCVWPGCDRPAHQCQVDHGVPFARGGPTDAANAGPMCASHNRFKGQGHTVWRDPGGYWHTYRPDGTEIG